MRIDAVSIHNIVYPVRYSRDSRLRTRFVRQGALRFPGERRLENPAPILNPVVRIVRALFQLYLSNSRQAGAAQ